MIEKKTFTISENQFLFKEEHKELYLIEKRAALRNTKKKRCFKKHDSFGILISILVNLHIFTGI